MADNNSGAESQVQNPVVQQFIDGLRRLESESDNSVILAVFGEDSMIGNVQIPEPLAGVAGAEQFWNSYRKTFNEIESRFTRIIEAEGVAALEWVSSGTLETGSPFEYAGVSLLSISGDKVTNFMAYFDSRALATDLAH